MLSEEEDAYVAFMKKSNYSRRIANPSHTAGRTVYDLLFERSIISSSAARSLRDIDGLELLATASYVALGFTKAGVPMPFLGFVALLAAYHLVLRTILRCR